MRIGIVIDSACDLPSDYIEQHGIVVLPITVRIGEAMLADHRDEEATLNFLHSHIATDGASAETIPYSVKQIHDLFLQRLVIEYDYVFCMTISSQRSPIYEHATQASFTILNDYKAARIAAGIDRPFSLRVIDTGNLFAAQGVLAAEAVRLREQGVSPPVMRAKLEQLVRNIHGYMVPPDLHYMRARGKTKGDRSISLMSATLGTALDLKPIIYGNNGYTASIAKIKGYDTAATRLFDFAVERVRAGLLTPTVCLSYGGEAEDRQALPGYARLRDTCAEYSVELLESVMSLTGMVNIGKGALTMGLPVDGQYFR